MPKAGDYRTTEYRGYKIVSYKSFGSKSKYNNHRIQKVVRPDGSLVDGLKWGFKFWSKYPNPVSSVIGTSHESCVKFVKSRIDHEVEGTEHPTDRRERLRAELKELRSELGWRNGSDAFEEKYGIIPGVNVLF